MPLGHILIFYLKFSKKQTDLELYVAVSVKNLLV
jgi:hypothetical protein